MTDYYERDGAFDLYMRKIKNYPRISREREKELSKIILHSKDKEAVDKAKEELVTANLLLVVKQAQRYRNPSSRFTLTLMDIIEEGNIGLMRAAECYDAENEVEAKFGTFATLLIRHQITRAIQESHIIRTPSHHHEIRYKINQLKEKYGDDLTDEIIMKELDISKDMLGLVNTCHVTYLENMGVKNEEGDNTGWQDWMPDPDGNKPYVEKKSLLNYLRKEMDKLTDRERSLVYEYYLDTEANTLEDLGNRHNITRERVRQILAKAIRKLRNNIVRDWNKNSSEQNQIDANTWTKLKLQSFRDRLSRRETVNFEEQKDKLRKIRESLAIE